MIIRIEDAPNIKHIKIDINFEDDNAEINITNDMEPSKPSELTNLSKPEKAEYSSMMEDIALDTDETYDISDEVVTKPTIPDIERKAKVSDDMENLEL